MTDSKYFQTTRKGEVFELKADLNSNDHEKKLTAVKKVIAAMTVGKDVSMLFVDVLKCMQTTDLELKKLIYLYLINYAKSLPELAILAVSTFIRDIGDKNPLIRALALRTMACIRVDQIVEYLSDPLSKTLKDKDPYVRKTAAVCVAKLHDVNPDLAEMGGFVDGLIELLGDPTPMVVANAVAALSEISENSAGQLFRINTEILNNLLAALSECTEWGQIFILDALATFTPRDFREAEHIIERILPRLAHANSAVVLSAVKIIILFLDHTDDTDFKRSALNKLGPPCVSLLSSEPEIQYVALRNLALIVQKYPNLLANHFKMFFCKYYDPGYVKLEKIELLIRLVSDRNVDEVLNELKSYAREVDIDFCRSAILAIGRAAIKLPVSADRCISSLMELIDEATADEDMPANHVVQAVIVAVRDIFRRYPATYEATIAKLCENLDLLDEPEARAAMIWIIGEYAERIPAATELLEEFLETWEDDLPAVRLQLLTAIVKCFLKKPDEAQAMVQSVLQIATENTLTPDLRDRAYVYWRLLSTDPEAAKTVVLSEKPVIDAVSANLEAPVLRGLLKHISCMASVYHKPPELFLKDMGPVGSEDDDYLDEVEDRDEAVAEAVAAAQAGLNGVGSAGPAAVAPTPGPVAAVSPVAQVVQPTPPAPAATGGGSLIDLMSGGPTPPPSSTGSGGGSLLDLMSGGSSTPPTSNGGGSPLVGLGAPAAAAGNPVPVGVSAVPGPQLEHVLFLDGQKGKGMRITGTFFREGGAIVMEMTFTNQSIAPLSGFAISLNKNSFGLTPASGLVVGTIGPNESSTARVGLATTGTVAVMNPVNVLQVAIKNNVDVHYFQTEVPVHALLAEGAAMERNEFLAAWKSIDAAKSRTAEFAAPLSDLHAAHAVLQSANFTEIAAKAFNDQATGAPRLLCYYVVQFVNGLTAMVEVTYGDSNQKAVVRSEAGAVIVGVLQAVEQVISQKCR